MMPQRLVVDAKCEIAREITWSDVNTEYDWVCVGDRVSKSFAESGLSYKPLMHLLGLDISAPDYWEKRKALDPLRTIHVIASFLGIPAVWLLTGEGRNPFDPLDRKQGGGKSAKGVSDSSVVQGNSGTVVINNGGTVDACKTELMRICGVLPMRKQVELLAFAYELEEQNTK